VIALVVDGSRATRMIIRKSLARIGYDAVEASHGKEAPARPESGNDVAVAFIDWNMPEINGLELVAAIRQDAALDGIRPVMVTSETELERVQAALQAGANEYVMKPFAAEILKEKLALLGLGGG
jgi:two-component system chemotaxis response regulator CheY